MVPFQFAAGAGVKSRPAIIVSTPQFHTSRADAIMLALTSQPGRSYYGDYILQDWQQAGLPLASTAKGVIRTIEQRLITRHLGQLTQRDQQGVGMALQAILSL
jgi:mRNA interferase MazF